jgi:hypothetical protein
MYSSKTKKVSSKRESNSFFISSLSSSSTYLQVILHKFVPIDSVLVTCDIEVKPTEDDQKREAACVPANCDAGALLETPTLLDFFFMHNFVSFVLV